jgi:eukaryotic-like serine/threonine-protein kinase
MMLAGRYRLEARLGRGGMGEVWRAWDTRLVRPVAVKLLPDAAAGDAALAARFRREAHTAALINSPRAVAVYDFGVSLDRCFLVMEYVEGRTLAEELRQVGPLPPQRVAKVAREAATGLVAAHQQGIVHRDIKPSNLLVDADGDVKIADFGIARSATGESTTGTGRTDGITGTSLYLAPEAAQGEAVGPPGDIYSLGCTAYELLTGRPPFVAEHPLAVLCAHVECEPTDPRFLRPELPAVFGAYVLRMLAKNPLARPTAQQTADWFADLDRHDMIAVHPVTPPGVRPPVKAPAPPRAAPSSPGRRRPTVLAGAGVSAAALAAALALTTPLFDDAGPASHPPAPRSEQTTNTGSWPSATPTAQPEPSMTPAGDVRTAPHGHHPGRGHRKDQGGGPAASPSTPARAHSGKPSSQPTPTTPQPTPSSPQPTPSSPQPTPSGTAQGQGAAQYGG